MSTEWPYADLSKAAKAAGGPEKYVDMLVTAAKNSGKLEVLPWVGAAAVGASLLTFATMKVINYFRAQKEKSNQAMEIAKQEIINGIKEYDAAHSTDDESGNATE